MATVQASTGEQEFILQAAANQYHVPVSILKGVYAVETSSGQKVETSSADAQGAFQFLPATAKQYNYPLTNSVDQSTFTQQAYAAAHYLSDLLHAHGGNWDAALQAYSGGGYGLAKVQAASGAKISGSEFTGPVGAVAGAASSVASTAGSVASGVGNIATLLTSSEFWIRLGEGLFGVMLLYLGLHALTGNSNSVGDQAKHVRRVFIPV